MNSNQKEILERLLLMMKYDSSKTLNENIEIINEQYSPSKGGFNGDKTGWKPYSYSDYKGKYMSNVEGWSEGVEFPYVGQWVPISDSRLKNPKTNVNFRMSKDGDGAFFIPLTYEQPDEGYYSKGLFHDWDGKVLKDANGFYYINMYEEKADSNSFLGLKKTGNYFSSYLIKNGKGLKYNPFTMYKGVIDSRVSSVKLSDTLLDKSGKLKDTKNLKNLLESIDKPEEGFNEWLKNPTNSELGKLVDAWVNLIMSKNLNELLVLYNDVVKLGKGGNTPDLPNFGKGTTTLSSIILENEIYNRRSQNRQQGGPEPRKPEVIDGKKMYGIPQGYFVKTATELYNKTYESLPKENDGDNFREWFISKYPDKAKNPCGDGEPLFKSGPYNNKWILCAANYKPKGSDVNAYNLYLNERKKTNIFASKDGGIKPENGEVNPELKYVRNLADYNDVNAENVGVTNQNCSPFCFLNDEELNVFKSCVGSSNPPSDNWKILRNTWDLNDKDTLSEMISYQLFACQPTKISSENSKFLTKKINNKLFGKLNKIVAGNDSGSEQKRQEVIKGQITQEKRAKEKEKEIEEIKQKEEFYKWVIKQQRVINIYNTEWLECTIGVKNESECGNTPYCGRAGKEFLEKIARGELKTSKGKTVGSAYRDSSGNVKYYVPDVDNDGDPLKNQWDVPCTSDTWDEYGGYIQMGAALAGIIASTVLTGPFGLAATTGLIVELSIDAIAGGYALYQSIKEKDNIGIAVNSIFLALPFLLDIPAADKLFKEIKYGKKAITDLSSKFDNFKLSNPTYSTQDLQTWLTGLNGYELNTFNKVIKETQTDSYFQKTMKDAINKNSDLFANATSTTKRFWIPKPGLQKMIIYVGPMGGYIFAVRNKIIKDSLIRLQSNKRLSVQQVVAWDAALFGLTNDGLLEIQRRINENPFYLLEQSNTAEFKEVEKTKKQLENTKLSPEDADRFYKELQSDIDNLVKQQNLSASEPIESVKTEEPSKPSETTPSQGVRRGRGDAK
jgi:hypothetical protein